MLRMIRAAMNEKSKERTGDRGSLQAPALRPLEADVIRFVEALAIADARRDHLAASQSTAIDCSGGRYLSSQAKASTNDSRSHLRPILD
jgi:hypothetical protein